MLIVEDDPDIASTMEDIFVEAGCTVRVARDGQHGIELLHAGYRPSLVVTDLMMPRMDGQTFIEQLRLIPELRNVRIVVLTAARNPDVPPGVSVIRKPPDIRALHDLIAED